MSDARSDIKSGIKSTRHGNILAARIIADTVRSTLGPRGMDKVIVDETQHISVTNDGATILRNLQSDHPVARMICEIALSQEAQVGDGTTSAVLIAGELLKNAQQLLDQHIHPTIIAQGYIAASQKSLVFLDELATDVSKLTSDTSAYNALLLNIAKTAMVGKSAEYDSAHLAKICVEAATELSSLSLDSIQILTQLGESALQSQFKSGIMVNKVRVHSQMPLTLPDAKIALVTCPLEAKEPELTSRLHISSPDQLSQFLAHEEKYMDTLVQKLIDAGITAVFSSKGIDEFVAAKLAKAGILGVRRVTQSDLTKLAQLTGAQISNTVSDISVGRGSISIQSIGESQYTHVTTQKSAKNDFGSIVLVGATQHVVDELARAVEDALGDLRAVSKSRKIVGGAGSIEIQLSQKLQEFARTLTGKEQLAVIAYAKSLEIIPQVLAENSGFDSLDILSQLHANPGFGVCMQHKVMCALDAGIVEPIDVKRHALRSASDVAVLVLRIDDILLPPKDISPQG